MMVSLLSHVPFPSLSPSASRSQSQSQSQSQFPPPLQLASRQGLCLVCHAFFERSQHKKDRRRHPKQDAISTQKALLLFDQMLAAQNPPSSIRQFNDLFVVSFPALPTENPDEEFEVSDEDMEFFTANPQVTDFLTRIDRKQIDRHVTRVADKSEDEIERLYEKRTRNADPLDSPENDLQVDPVDALPIKTLDGNLQYRTG